MRRGAWNSFVKARDQYRAMLENLERDMPGLKEIQQELVDRKDGPSYKVETPVVYNRALDEIGPESDVSLILVADNPGRREQAIENRRYLVGPSGKLAETFFRNNPGLGVDLRKNAIILNKSPVHTPRTADLAGLCRLGGDALNKALAASQDSMARLLREFHQALAPLPVWITGYSEMRKGGVFETYTESLRKLYGGNSAAQKTRREELLFFRHFSMNQFTVDLKRQALSGETASETLSRIGAAYRRRILGAGA